MYEFLKKLLLVAEQIGTVKTVKQTDGRDRKYYDGDEINITGITPDGHRFLLSLELEDKESENADP